MMKKLRATVFIILSLFGCILSVASQAQNNTLISSQFAMKHSKHWSLQSQQQNDDDDVRERREEEMVREIRPVRLDRPQ